mmetsp:Transcript_50124/g.74838  ORF Transcript_50124/g.74838 Transcript_50124/m.74838 type:complete len:206 (-) Transcript_50124:513-1130(-)
MWIIHHNHLWNSSCISTTVIRKNEKWRFVSVMQTCRSKFMMFLSFRVKSGRTSMSAPTLTPKRNGNSNVPMVVVVYSRGLLTRSQEGIVRQVEQPKNRPTITLPFSTRALGICTAWVHRPHGTTTGRMNSGVSMLSMPMRRNYRPINHTFTGKRVCHRKNVIKPRRLGRLFQRICPLFQLPTNPPSFNGIQMHKRVFNVDSANAV